MKLLLDENIPHDLRPLLMPMHEVLTVAYMGWKGIENGDLLALAAANGFDAIVTMDQGIQYEQDKENLPCSVIVLVAPSNKLDDLRPLIAPLLAMLVNLKPKSLAKVTL